MKKLLIRKIKPLRNQWFLKMKKFQFMSQEENLQLQNKYLKEILEYSIEKIPYYKEIFTSKKINLSADLHQEIKKFPILTKKILRQNFYKLTATDFAGNYQENTSGGSTGEPVVFLQDNIFKERGAAVKALFEEWAGGGPGEKKITLWGSERDVLGGTTGLGARFSNFLNSRKFLNSFMMSKEDMYKYIKIINAYKPKVIEAYVQSAYELSRFIKDKGLRIYSPSGIVVSAGTLDSEAKKLIASVFNCNVLNRYGSREVGDVACSCDKDKGLHLNIFNHYIEFLDDNLNPCSPGEIGQIYVTTLQNKIMPLIRYQIGDIGVPSENKQCSCGRGLPLIAKVSGRVNSMIKTSKGVFDGTALTTSFYPYKSIKKYQFIQKTKSFFVLLVVIQDQELWEIDKKSLLKRLRKILGEDIEVDFVIQQELPPLKSGKYSYIISNVK